MKTTLPLMALCGLLCCRLGAQKPLPVPRDIQACFDKGTRSMDGQPGRNYWQNHAAYDIQVDFDPNSRLLKGSENILYTNESPDTLRQIVFKLYPNYYQSGAPRMMPVDSADLNAGVRISQLSVNGEARQASAWHISGTEMTLRIPALLPHHDIRLQVSWSYTLNKGSHMRTGEIEPGAYFIAYFFPRVAVYDDIDGWNRNPYIGTQEFYNDFCSFQLAVTVPKDFVVWATGDLRNCTEVLAPKYCERIAAAERADPIAWIIDSADLKTRQITAQNPSNTFRFAAAQVSDMAMAISDHYLWQASSVLVEPGTGRRTRVDAVFNPKHRDYFEVAGYARQTVEAMSFRFPKWPYPYPHETVFDGLDQMEYPMMVNDNPLEDKAEAIELTDHEIFHTMFPFYMGINETKYGWMDEGWATIGEWLISPMIDTTIDDDYGVDRYEQIAGKEADLPIVRLTTQQNHASMFTNSYPKPAMGYLYARDLLGDSLFFQGLHHYIRTWNGKHPMPLDFFNCMNAGAKQNLNWFWQRWFYDDGVPDLAIARVSGGRRKVCIRVDAKGTKPVPVDLTLVFQDGTRQKIHRSVAVWADGRRSVTVRSRISKALKEIRLGSTHVPDVNKSDNLYKL